MFCEWFDLNDDEPLVLGWFWDLDPIDDHEYKQTCWWSYVVLPR